MISYKIFIYLLLLLPALSLMAGGMLARRLAEARSVSLRAENIAAAVIMFIVGVIAVVPWFYGATGFPKSLAPWLETINGFYLRGDTALLPVAVTAFAASVLVVVFTFLRRRVAVIAVLCFAMLGISTGLARIVAPRLDPIMCPKEFCEEIGDYKDEGFAVGEYWVEFGILNYYARTNMVSLRSVEEMVEFLRDNPRAVIAITENHWRLNEDLLNTVEVAYAARITGNSPEKTFYLLVQDGDMLKPLAEAMREYREKGYALAIYKNGDILLKCYLDGEVAYISTEEELTAFLDKHEKAAFIASRYRRTREKGFLRSFRVTNRTDFYRYRYYILLKEPDME